MNTTEFLQQTSLIEDHLFNLNPEFNKGRGLMVLLGQLQRSRKIDQDLFLDLRKFWEIRNQMVGFPPKEIKVSAGVTERLEKIQRKLRVIKI